MFYSSERSHHMSLRLSEVMDDIGVNEKMIMKMRKSALLGETMSTITLRATRDLLCDYNFGSISEGSTTPGLKSDMDNLVSRDDEFIVIGDLSEWTPNFSNFLMIQDQTTPPGYCLLQKLRADAPQPATDEDGNHFVKDVNGRILHKNTVLNDVRIPGRQIQGPSMASQGGDGCMDCDTVSAFSFKTMPDLAKRGLDQLNECPWQTEEMKAFSRSAKCFVVGTGFKGGENSEFEWRISTSLIERCLMFNLSITQLRCYILMKMIVKTYLIVGKESFISSFMCKTVLLYCLLNQSRCQWGPDNLLNLLNYCLFTLKQCLICKFCPHFIVRGNNLMGGKIPYQVKHELLQRLSKLLPCVGTALFGIQIDQLGLRFQAKLNMIDNTNIQPADSFMRARTSVLLLNAASIILDYHKTLIFNSRDDILKMNLKPLFQTVRHLIKYNEEDDPFAKMSCKLLAPLLCTVIGSLMAAQAIQHDVRVPPESFTWFEAGLNSDVASGKLKFASMLYCTGDIVRAEALLSDIEQHYIVDITEPICVCHDFPRPYIRKGFTHLTMDYEVEAAKSIVAFCVCFFRSEIPCIPHELQYELFRSTYDYAYRNYITDLWMDCAVIDSLPFLYYLQYLTYSRLQNPLEKQRALRNLRQSVITERNLGHKETVYNILGQCMEQENRYVDALSCYTLSLRIRGRNNAAKILLCKCLAHIMSKR